VRATGRIVAIVCLLWPPAGFAAAGEAEVISATARCDATSLCEIIVTLEHADEGWRHYADRWDVLDPEGRVLATRVLRHPHVQEQPFTRSLPDVQLPAGLTHVSVRGHDSVHGDGAAEQRVEIERPDAPGTAR
jgi:hypothetical protein